MSRYAKRKINGVTYQEHRLIMENHLGRELRDDEIVHHKNNNPRDNRVANLEVMTHQKHSEHHNQKHPRVKTCEVCGTKYEPAPTKRERAKTCKYDCARELMRRAAVEREAKKRREREQSS